MRAATQEEAATAYDIAAIEYRGLNAITNFGLSRYIKWLRPNGEGAIGSDPPTGVPTPHGLLRPPNQSNVPEAARARGGASAGPSALGLLFQSSKFKEMLQKTSPETTGTPSSSSSSAPATPNSREDNKSLIQCNFPDYIQTYFECQNGRSFVEEEDDSIFGDFGDFMPSPLIEEGM